MKQRLQTIVELISPNSRIIDIGSDHLLIPNRLIDQGICSLVFASDVNDGPIKAMILNRGSRNIDIVKSDGLRQFDGPIDSAIIAGMGGRLIQRILEESAEKFQKLDYIVLQPMQQVEELRNFLMKNYCVKAERLIAEDGKVYHILKVIPGHDDYDAFLTKGLAPVQEIKAYYNHQMRHLKDLLTRVPPEHQTSIRERLTRLQQANMLY